MIRSQQKRKRQWLGIFTYQVDQLELVLSLVVSVCILLDANPAREVYSRGMTAGSCPV